MKIIVTESEVMDHEVKRMLSALGHVHWGPLQNDEFERALSECEVLMVRLGLYIGPVLMAQAPRLQFVVTATTGLDHIDLEAAAAGGIKSSVCAIVLSPSKMSRRLRSTRSVFCWRCFVGRRQP